MADKGKSKPYLSTVVFGILSALALVFVFKNQDMMTDVTSRGGSYAALPILVAFYFSFVHGGFAGNVLSLMGIEAAKKK